MSRAESPSIHAAELHKISDDEARHLVDRLLGASDVWPSLLVAFRLGDESQADWKAEVGHRLQTAGELDAQEALARIIVARARAAAIRDVDLVRNADDQSHRILNQVLAEAMVAHYLRGTAWAVTEWRPGSSDDDGDVDLRCRTRSSRVVNVQVKASDSPVVESAERVLGGIEKAASQLRPHGDACNVIVMCAQRHAPLSQDCGAIGHRLIGSTSQFGSAVLLARADRGSFDEPEWRHVSAVVLLDYLRGFDEFKYPCTVLLNPWATVRMDESDFPRARVLTLDEREVFHWVRGAPSVFPPVPDGTFLSERGWFERPEATP